MTNDDPPHLCDGMRSALANDAIPIRYGDTFREYGITVLDGGSAHIRMSFCPYCGTKLPESLRDAWFERLEELGLEWNDARTPADMQTGAWWRQR